MRRWLVGIAWVALTACGGGGGGSGSTAVSGTIGGQAFTPAEVSAVEVGPAMCTVLSQNVNVKAFAVRLASFTGICNDLASDPLCKLEANARSVTVVFADIGAVAGPTLGTGTFNVDPDPTNAQAVTSGPLAGTLYVAFAGAVTTTASCPVGTVGEIAKGTLTITAVDSSKITGSMDLTFGNVDQHGTFTAGTDTLKGDFTATVCGTPTFDLCTLATTGGSCMSPHC